jgi:hypothetical protein
MKSTGGNTQEAKAGGSGVGGLSGLDKEIRM